MKRLFLMCEVSFSFIANQCPCDNLHYVPVKNFLPSKSCCEWFAKSVTLKLDMAEPGVLCENDVIRLVGSREKLESVICPVVNVPLQQTLQWMLKA